MRAVALLPNTTRQDLIYVVVGQPADCGRRCVDHYSTIEQLANELSLTDQVLTINEHLSQVEEKSYLAIL
jgi:hypothetical protein